MTWESVVGRLRSEMRLKLVLTVVLNLWFYVPYGLLQRHHLFRATQMSPSALDRLVPFSDGAVWIYLSIFLLMPIGPLLMNRRAPLMRYGLGIWLIGAISYVVFIFWPTWCPRPTTTHMASVYRLLIAADTPFNAFPSLHAAFAVFSALCGLQVLRDLESPRIWRIGIWVWTLLILVATLMTRQHMVADIIAGSALAFGVYIYCFKGWNSCLSAQIRIRVVNTSKVRPDSTL